MQVALSTTNSGDPKSEHEKRGVSKEKPSCLTVESFSSVFRVGALGMSMAQNLSCRINVGSRSLLRITFGWPEGHDLGSREGDGICFVSQASLGEMNGDMHFTSSNGT
jgi:hypothetical protein